MIIHNNVNSALGMALIAASTADELLRQQLSSYLLKSSTSDNLLSFKGAIGTFSARIQLCYALAIISKTELNALIILQDIRNMFAHRLDAKFSDIDIAPLIEKLGNHVGLKSDKNADYELMKTIFTISARKIIKRISKLRKSGQKIQKVEDIAWETLVWENVPLDVSIPDSPKYDADPVSTKWNGE